MIKSTHTCDLVHTICSVCLVLAESGIMFGFEVAAVVSSSAGAVSVCASAVVVSTVAGNAGALYFRCFLRAMIGGIAVDLQRDEEEEQWSSCYR